MKIQAVLLTAVLLLSPSTALPALAQNRAESWEFGPYLVGVDFDPDTEIEDEVGAGFRFGYNFTRQHEIEFLFDQVSTEDSVIGQINVDSGKIASNYLFNLNYQRHQPVVPYLTAGLGFIRFDVDDPFFGSDDEVDTLFNFGGGVRFFFGPVFNLRLDFRSVFFQGDNVILRDLDFQNNEFSFGIGWVLGGRTGRRP